MNPRNHDHADADSECPPLLRRALLDLLTWTLLFIRNEARNEQLCFAFSDHMHNIPALLNDFRSELLRYYWKVERTCFLSSLERIGWRVPIQFAQAWEIVETEYRRICDQPSA
jgi:hypothetical protein